MNIPIKRRTICGNIANKTTGINFNSAKSIKGHKLQLKFPEA